MQDISSLLESAESGNKSAQNALQTWAKGTAAQTTKNVNLQQAREEINAGTLEWQSQPAKSFTGEMKNAMKGLFSSSTPSN